MRILATIAAPCMLLVAACSRSDSPPPPASAVATNQTPVASSGGAACPATGQWATCSLLYHLDRAGLAPRLDSSASPAEKELGGQTAMLKIGQSAELELHVYPDSTARIADEKKINRADFVSAAAPQTMRRERTLIESVNVLGLLTSINDHQRERVSDAITAGPPQPAQPVQPVQIANPANPAKP